MTQQGWAISSSDDDEIGYIPLSKRLKSSGQTDNLPTAFSNSDDDLPIFSSKTSNTILKKSCVDSLTNKENIYENSGIINLDDDNVNETKNIKQSKKSNKTKDDEKIQRKAHQDHLKTLRPTECMKYMVCEVSDLALTMFDGNDLLKDLSAESEATFKSFSSDAACVRWKRKIILSDNDGSETVNDEPLVAILIHCDNFIAMVNAEQNHSSEQTLQSWTDDIQQNYTDFKIHLIVVGMKEYKKKIKKKLRKDFKDSVQATSQIEKSSKRKRKNNQNNAEIILNDNQIEEAVVGLLMAQNISIRFIDSSNDFCELIARMTKAIGETPFKRMNFQEDAIVLDIPAVKINPNSGEGCKRLWKLMIQQFENVSPDMSCAIVDKYPSITSLLNAYSQCTTNTARALLLEDIIVRRGIGTIQTQRRIGPGLSKKIHKWATTRDAKDIP